MTITAAKSTERAEVAQIRLRSKEETFHVGYEDEVREVAYKRSFDRVSFSAGLWHLSFQKDSGKNLTFDPLASSKNMSQNLKDEDYLMECILSLVKYAADKEGLKLPEGPEEIRSKAGRIKGFQTPYLLLTTRTFSVSNGDNQTLIDFNKKADVGRGYFSNTIRQGRASSQELIFPFEIYPDSKNAGHYILSLHESNRSELVAHKGIPISGTEIRALTECVQSLAKHIAEQSGWTLFLPPSAAQEAESKDSKPVLSAAKILRHTNGQNAGSP
jgi:hypothetical protein